MSTGDVSHSRSSTAAIVDLLKMLADESRLRIVLALVEHGELHVTAMCNMLRKSQPAVSHHLNLLRHGGLVRFRRTGKCNFYRLDGTQTAPLLHDLFRALGDGRNRMQFGDFTLTRRRK